MFWLYDIGWLEIKAKGTIIELIVVGENIVNG